MSKEFILTIGIVASLAVVFFIVVPVLAGVIENKKNPKKKRKLSVFEIVIYVILMAYSFILIFLVVWAFNASLKTSDRWDFDTYSLITDWQFSNFATAYKFVTASVPGTNIKANVFQCLMNGFLFSGGAAFFQTLCTVIVAYCTSRYDCKLSKIIHTVVIIVLVLPIAGNLASQYEIAVLTHTYDNLPGMFVMKFGYSNMYYLVFYSVFKAIPKDYAESALLDGANHLMVFMRIMLPLVMTLVGAIFLLFFIQYWNDYQYPMIFLPSMPTASYALYLFINVGGGDGIVAGNTPLRIAAGFLVFIPILVIFVIFRNKIMGNLQEGGIKC